MKKLIVLLVMMCSLAPVLRAADGCNQRLSPAEFRARQAVDNSMLDDYSLYVYLADSDAE